MTGSATLGATTRLRASSGRLIAGGVVVAGAAVLMAAQPVAAALAFVGIAAALWLRDPGPDGWRKPVYLVLVFLPVSTVLTLLLGALAGDMGRLVAWSPLWREALLFGTLGLAAIGVFFGRIRQRFVAEDWLALGFVGLVLLYAVLGLGSRGGALSTFQRAAGARAWLLPLGLYFLGRVTPQSPGGREGDLALVRRLVWFVTATAFVEFFLLGDFFWQRLDFARYLRAIGTPESGIYNGVTANYYAFDQHGATLRRWPAFMGTLSLGYWYLGALAIVVAAAWDTRSRWLIALLAVGGVALVGSRSRAAMGGLAIALVLLSLLRWRKRSWIVAGIAALLAGAIALNVAPEIPLELALRGRLPVDPSALGHLAAIVHGTQAILQEPFGFGLGTAGFVGIGFADRQSTVVGESLYLSLAAELGWLGALLFVGFVLLAAWRLGRYALEAAQGDSRWVLAAGLAVATIGYLLASVTTEVWRGLQAGALYWWLLGVTTTTVRHDAERAAP